MSQLSLSKTPQEFTNNGTPVTKFTFGVGWTAGGGDKKGLAGRFNRKRGVDLHASVVAFDNEGNPVRVCHGENTSLWGGALSHSGDNRTGAGDGPDESIDVDLTGLPDEVSALVCVLSSYKGQTFEKVEDADCEIIDTSGGSPVKLASVMLPINKKAAAAVLAKVTRSGNAWQIATVKEFDNARTVSDVQRVAKNHL